MNVELLNPIAVKAGLRIIKQAGRICYASEGKDNSDSFIARLIASGHESVIEHGVATFHIRGISRACSHQLVRHRLASYSQRSQRYVKEDGFKYVMPSSIINAKGDIPMEYENMMAVLDKFYNYLVDNGIPKEDARFVLPNACCTEIVMTMNFRELRHFLKLRLAPNAQWEIRTLARIIRDIMLGVAPVIVEDFYPKGD